MEANMFQVPCSTDSNDFILVQVRVNCSKPLHLTLIGTEGEGVYSASIKSDESLGFAWSDTTLSQHKFEQLISSIFLGVSPGDQKINREEFEMVSDVINEALVISVMEKVEGITKQHGKITLLPDEQEISLFHWCSFALGSGQKHLNDVKGLESKVEKRDRQIAQLEASLAELTTLKVQHEDEMLQKFTVLLNEKKKKIRELQRLLSSIKDPQGSVVESTYSASIQPHLATKNSKATRQTKRKANWHQCEEDGERCEEKEEELSGSEIKLEEGRARDRSYDNQRTTPTVSDTESDEGNAFNLTSSAISASLALDVVIPPKRQLPFAQKNTALAKESLSPINGLETESDDEL